MLDTLASVARRALRHRTFLAVTVVTLAVSLGTVATMFAVVEAFLLSALPYEEADELVMVWHRQAAAAGGEAGEAPLPLSPGAYADLAGLDAFEGTAAFFTEALTVRRGDGVERVPSLFVTGGLFELLGREAALGRTLSAADAAAGAPPVVVISHGFWQRHFGGDPQVLGRTVEFGGREHTVVGVLPADFRFTESLVASDPVLSTPVGIWVPFDASGRADQRGFRFLTTLGRLAPSTSVEAARAEAAAQAANAARLHPDTDAGYELAVVPLRDQIFGPLRPILLTLLAATLLVLLVACVNLAALFTARMQKARHERAIRAALGAGRGRIFGESLAEALVLALAGGALAVGVAAAALTALGRLAPLAAFRSYPPQLDPTVVLATLGLSLLAGLAVGVVPAWRASRLGAGLGAGRAPLAPRSRLAFTALVAAQLALTTTLLIGMGLSFKSFLGLLEADLGYETRGVLAFDLFLTSREYRDPVRKTAFYSELLDRLEALPEVEAASMNYALPLNGVDPSNGYEVVGSPPAPGEAPSADLSLVDPGYFATLGIPVVGGRGFRSTDTAEAPLVAIVDQRLVERHFPDQDPLGRRIRVASDEELTIVGVVGSVDRAAFGDPRRPAIYLPFAQRSYLFTTVALRTDLDDPLALSGPVRRTIQELDPGVPIADPTTLERMHAEALSNHRFGLLLMSAFAGLSLLLTLVGVYGVMSYLVARRLREAGIRIALGAKPAEVTRLVVREGLATSVIGTAIGLALGAAASEVLANVAYGVETFDPIVFAVVPLVLLVATFLAYAPPAITLGRVDPNVHLRAA